MSQDTMKPVCQFEDCDKEADITCTNCDREVCDEHYHNAYMLCVTCAYKIHGSDALR